MNSLATLRNNFHALITAGSLLFCASMAIKPAFAVDPDIPRIEADAQRGSMKQEIQLAAAYFVGRGVPQDLKTAAYWYEKAADSGDPAAQNEIGYLYQTGMGVTKNLERSAHWYQRSAASGLVAAKVNLAVSYLTGLGVPKRPDLAIQMLREAAAHGNGYADCYLGDIYRTGVYVKGDQATAQQWYEKGAAVHNPIAEYRLGYLLSAPESQHPDIKKAAELLRKSEASGYVPATHQLALFLIHHPDQAHSSDEAKSLLEISAAAGEWRSSILLAVLSRDGIHTPKDQKAAYYHFTVARLQGGDEAAPIVSNDLNALSAKLEPAEISATESEASKWAEQHHAHLQFIYSSDIIASNFPAYALESSEQNAHAGRLVPTPII